MQFFRTFSPCHMLCAFLSFLSACSAPLQQVARKLVTAVLRYDKSTRRTNGTAAGSYCDHAKNAATRYGLQLT